MGPHPSYSEMIIIAEALRALRDSWVNLSLILKDQIADVPSPERDEVMM